MLINCFYVYAMKGQNTTYLKTLSQFQHVYKESYQVAAAHLFAHNQVAAIVEDSHL